MPVYVLVVPALYMAYFLLAEAVQSLTQLVLVPATGLTLLPMTEIKGRSTCKLNVIIYGEWIHLLTSQQL